MIRFSRFIVIYAIISSVALGAGIISLVTNGLKPSVDFSGGTLIELAVQNGGETMLRDSAEAVGIELVTVQESGTGTYLLRTKESENAKFDTLLVSLNSEASAGASVVRRETVGPTLGRELLVKTVTAAVVAIIAILMYVAYAFRNVRFGVAAIIALLHDSLIVIGAFSLLGVFAGVEVDTLFVTALLTTMSFSVHDTIVVFDRIREYQKRMGKQSFEDITDRALTETMGRSLANSVTIILMLFALVLLGGESVKWFAVALLVGTVSGTYSSPFVATPVLLLWHRRDLKKKRTD